MSYFCYGLTSVGIFFLLSAAIGAIRFPDFYTRSNAIGVVDTIGSLFLLGGLMFHYGLSFVTAKIAFVILFIYIANPTITHVLVRAALRHGLKPWAGGKHD